jgi:DNA-directed RNA polymerase subunit RPC12/RpoP
MGVMIGGGATEGEVEAQGYYCYTRCPWCGHVGRSICSSTVYLYYTCGWCGRPFRA